MSRPAPPRSPRSAHAEVVQAEVERIVASPSFGGTARQVRLLRFLVAEVLAGRGDTLSAPLIAARVFDRREELNPSEDSIVRVEMSKLRRALERYHATGAAGAVRIDVPRGSHTPTLTAVSRGERQAASEPPAPDQETEEPVTSRRSSQPPSTRRSPPTGEREGSVAPAADGPVLAVLPFASINAVSTTSLRSPAAEPSLEQASSGVRSRAFAHGITERLSALFARAPCATVLSHGATLEEASARGARYVLEGSVRLVPGGLRVSAKLHDTRRGVQVWGNVYDRFGGEDQLFAAEDDVARTMTIELLALPLGVVNLIEAQERAGHPPRSAYEVALRFPRWLFTFDPQEGAAIMDACERLLAAQPNQGMLLGALSMSQTFTLWSRDGTPQERRRIVELARLAVAAEPTVVGARHALGLALLDAGDARGALAEAEAALALAGPILLTGMVMTLAGAWERGAAVIRAHLALLKHYPRAVHHALSLEAYRRGDYVAALAEAETIAAPHLAWGPLDRAIALARLGRRDEAEAAGRALAAILPRSVKDPRAFAARLTADPAARDEIVVGLGLAGLP